VRQSLRRIRGREQLPVRYFDSVLPVELAAVNDRRKKVGRSEGVVRLSRPDAPHDPDERDRSDDPDSRSPFDIEAAHRDHGPSPARTPSPDPHRLFEAVERLAAGPAVEREGPALEEEEADPARPDPDRMRPQPVPCTATGLALSGGGIRSAALCLGGLQALNRNKRLDSIDYMSSVSGGGYIAACLSAGMTTARAFPFGPDVSDNDAISHLRNYSNYLLPRGRSGPRNAADAAAVILRGLLANAAIVFSIILFCAAITLLAFPNPEALTSESLAPALVGRLLPDWLPLGGLNGWGPFGFTWRLLLILAALLLAWAVLRSFKSLDRLTDDTRGRILGLARMTIYAVAAAAFLDLQPVAVVAVNALRDKGLSFSLGEAAAFLTPLAAFVGAVAAFASRLGKFLQTSRSAQGWRPMLQRLLTRIMILAAAAIVPALLWLSYLCLCAWAIYPGSKPPALPVWLIAALPFLKGVPGFLLAYSAGFAILYAISLKLDANGYSLHRFYRDRLSTAFLFCPVCVGKPGGCGSLDRMKLSYLKYADGPYHIINAALNVQGSAEANRRGRDADFFMFTPHHIGSDLTFYAPTGEPGSFAPTLAMEEIDSRLDLATAMAISGAAVSANMGGSTIRSLSPTLALLNVRLGYWLRNPRWVARPRRIGSRIGSFFSRMFEKFYLLPEMLNLLDETGRDIYLTDGGHIENLGLYELLKRGCGLVIVIDAEADPELSFASLLKVERYARIDLGVRIILPWEEISRCAAAVETGILNRNCPRDRGPHCAIGRIAYADGSMGILVYFKASLSGDEKDYILDYKLRNLQFPHETTGDQFFSEEQFEMYRALGFHMVDGLFSGDRFCWIKGKNGFASEADALTQIEALLPKL
jgi:hypothetical protein